MRSTRKQFPAGALVAADAVLIATAMAAAYYVRIEGAVIPYYGVHDVFGYLQTAAVVVPFWIGIHFAARLYHPDTLGSGSGEYAQILKASTFGVVLMTMLSFWVRSVIVSRGWVLICWLLSAGLLTAGRFSIRRLLWRARRRGRYCSRALIVGTNQRAISIATQFARDRASGVSVAAFLDDSLPPGAEVTDGIRVWGSPAQLPEAVPALDADEVLIISEALDWETFQEVMQYATALPNHVRARLCPRLHDFLTTGIKLGEKADIPVLTLAGMRITGRDAVLKRATDLAIAFVFLAVSAPLLLAIAALIRLVDRGPVLDRDRVVGLRGKPFDSLKFHTGLLGETRRTFLRSNSGRPAANRRAPMVGALLYRTGLDKLPQLLNVLAGQMSLVGPRTIAVHQRQLCDRCLPSLSVIHPGMTGPWVLSDPANLEEELQSTLYYVKNWSFWRDLEILGQTGVRILRARGRVPEGYVLPRVATSTPPRGYAELKAT